MAHDGLQKKQSKKKYKMFREMNLSKDEADKHWELHEYIINCVGSDKVLPFIINTLICDLSDVKDENNDKYLTKKEVLQLIDNILTNKENVKNVKLHIYISEKKLRK